MKMHTALRYTQKNPNQPPVSYVSYATMGTTWSKSDSGVISMILGSTPSQQRRVVGEVAEFYDPPRYIQTEHLPDLVARGKLDIFYLQLKDRFSGCSEPSHIRDVLLVEGFYARPDYDTEVLDAYAERVKASAPNPPPLLASYVKMVDYWKVSHDKRRKAARERVKKRRQRAN